MFTSFRGPYEVIYNRVKKYAKYYEKGAVLDIGCCRGEFLQVLKGNNIECEGLDNDENIILDLKNKGYSVKSTGFKEYKTSKKLAGIMAGHIIEHKRPYPLSLLESLLINDGFEIIDKGFDEDTGYKRIKKILRKFLIIGKYFTPKDIFIVGAKIKEI